MPEFDYVLRRTKSREILPSPPLHKPVRRYRYAVWVLYSTASGALGTAKVYANTLDSALANHDRTYPGNTALAYIIRRAGDNDTLQPAPLSGVGFLWRTVPAIAGISVEAVKVRPEQSKGIHVEVTDA